jgi:hypothetical protein
MSTDERREAKAEMEAAKARARALRPWYKKKLIMIPLVFVILIILISSMGGGGDGDSDSGGGQGSSEEIVQAQIPGEATLDTGDKTTTRFTGVTLRDESIPGNEFTKAPAGKTYMVFNAEIENVGDEDLDLNFSAYRLKLPSGEIVDYGMGSVADDELGVGLGTTLTPGAKKSGTLTWEVPIPTPGQGYVILWKPNPFDDKQAQFTYTHR